MTRNSVEPFGSGVRLINVHEFAENLPGPELPAWAEEYLAQERSWHRFLRGTELVPTGEARRITVHLRVPRRTG